MTMPATAFFAPTTDNGDPVVVNCGFVRWESMDAFVARLRHLRSLVAALSAISPWRHQAQSAVAKELRRLGDLIDDYVQRLEDAAVHAEFAQFAPPELRVEFRRSAHATSAKALNRRRNEADTSAADQQRANALAVAIVDSIKSM